MPKQGSRVMRIAHCIHGLDLGGAQQVVRHLVEGTSGVAECYVYSPVGGCFADDLRVAGGTVRIITRRIPRFDPAWVWRLATAMRRDRIDLVHAHLFGDSLHAYLATRMIGGRPFVMTLHSVARFHSAVQRLGYRWLLPRAAWTVACSRAVEQSFRQQLPGRPVRISAIPNGIRPPASAGDGVLVRARLGLPARAPVVAAVGRLVEEKGYDLLIGAFRAMSDDAPDAVLLFVGEGPLRPALEAMARSAGLGGRVIFAGFQRDVALLLPAVDVVAFSSHDEGMPIALLEAMAARRCVVATDVGGIGEAIRSDAEGLLVAPGDVDALAGALARAVDDRSLRVRLGDAAARRFQERFTADRMVTAYLELYQTVLGRDLPTGGVTSAVVGA